MDNSWTGTLLHKGKVISKICIKTTWPVPVKMNDCLELNQKMTQSNFINKVMPKAAISNKQSLSIDTPDINEETAIQIGIVEPVDEDSSTIWTKFSSFLSMSNSVAVANMESSGGHLFMTSPTNDAGLFGSLFANIDEKLDGASMCVIFLWDMCHLRHCQLPDPWGDIIHQDDQDLLDPKQLKREASDPDDHEMDEGSSFLLKQEDSEHKSASDDVSPNNRGLNPLTVLANLALAEEEKISAGVNPPNPYINESQQTVTDDNVTTLSDIHTIATVGSVGAYNKGRRLKQKPTKLYGMAYNDISDAGKKSNSSADDHNELADAALPVDKVIKQEKDDDDDDLNATGPLQETSISEKETVTKVSWDPSTVQKANNEEGEVTDTEEITDNDIISAQWQDEDTAANATQVLQQSTVETADKDKTQKINELPSPETTKVFFSRRSSIGPNLSPVKYDGSKTKGGNAVSPFGLHRKTRRSCTDSMFKVTIPGITSLRKQNLSVPKDSSKTTAGVGTHTDSAKVSHVQTESMTFNNNKDEKLSDEQVSGQANDKVFVICPEKSPVFESSNIEGQDMTDWQVAMANIEQEEENEDMYEKNLVRILILLHDAILNGEWSRQKCASFTQALILTMTSKESVQFKEEESRVLLEKMQETQDSAPCESEEKDIDVKIPKMETDKDTTDELQTQVSKMIQQAKKDILKDLRVTALAPRIQLGQKRKHLHAGFNPQMKKKKFPGGSVKHAFVKDLKVVPVGSPKPFGGVYGYHSVGTRSVKFTQHLWYTAYQIANGGIDNLKSQMILPSVSGLKRQKQGLIEEFGQEIIHGAGDRMQNRLYKEYDALHAFFNFSKTVLLAKVWFRSDYNHLTIGRLLFTHAKLLSQVKFLRQSRDLLAEALTWEDLTDAKRPIFHFGLNASIVFERELNKKLYECRHSMDIIRKTSRDVKMNSRVPMQIDNTQFEDFDFECSGDQPSSSRQLSTDKELRRLSRSSSERRGHQNSISPSRSSSHGRGTFRDKSPAASSEEGEQRTSHSRYKRGNTDYDKGSGGFKGESRRRTPSPFKPRKRVPHESSFERKQSGSANAANSKDGGHLTHPVVPTPQMMRNYKTKLCLNWLRHNCCKMGDSCSYAHGESDLKKRGVPTSAN